MSRSSETNPWSPSQLREEKYWPMDLFTRALALFVANKMGIFESLAGGPKELSSIVGELKTDPKGTRILLDALVGLQYVKRAGGLYENEKDTARYLTKESKDYLGTRFNHAYGSLRQWLRLEDLVRRGQKNKNQLPEFQKNPPEQEKSVREFTLGLDESSRSTAALVAGMLDLRGLKSLLDLGGGAGTYSIAFVRKWKALRPVVFELPVPARVAREQVKSAGLDERISVRTGDFLQDDLGEEAYDAVFVSNIIHNLSIEDNRKLFGKIWRALRGGGRVFIKDMMPNDRRTGPYYPLIFALTMLMFTDSGDTYSQSEVKGWLNESGFVRICQRIIIRGESSLVIGSKK